jgi:uncharacterized protein involved in outer membrane biogenesis
MRKGRIILITAAVLVLAVVAVSVYVLTNINFIVKEAIEKYGSDATKTAVRVSSVNIRLSSGEASIQELTVADPTGFTTPNIFNLSNISLRIDAKSLARSPLVIKELRIVGPEVFYEMNAAGVSNLDVLTKNLQGPGTEAKKPREKKEIKVSIRKLVLEKGRVEARMAALGDRPIMLDLPGLEMANIGGNEGATPEEIAKTVATALAQQTAKAVARSQGERYLRKGAERLLERYLAK